MRGWARETPHPDTTRISALARRLQAYSGLLSPAETAEGINAAQRNAVSLARDARLLLGEGRFARAASLAALSVEESGKISILRALVLSGDEKEAKAEWRRYRRHTEKNRLWGFPAAVAKGVRTLDEFAFLFDADSDHPHLLDQVKQLGLYTDCLGEKHWSEPHEVINEALATQLVTTAETMSSGREVSSEEIELWVEILGPVWKGPADWMKKALSEWHRALVERGLVDGDPDAMEQFVFGPQDDP